MFLPSRIALLTVIGLVPVPCSFAGFVQQSPLPFEHTFPTTYSPFLPKQLNTPVDLKTTWAPGSTKEGILSYHLLLSGGGDDPAFKLKQIQTLTKCKFSLDFFKVKQDSSLKEIPVIFKRFTYASSSDLQLISEGTPAFPLKDYKGFIAEGGSIFLNADCPK